MKLFSKHDSKKRKAAVITVVSLICISAIIAIAAFVGNGSTKGILKESEFNFNSNVLTSIQNASQAGSVNINTAANAQSVVIRNYSLSNGEVNHFDVTYNLTCSLSGFSATDPYEYYVTIGGQSTQITGTPVTFSNLNLPASEKTDNDFIIEFRLKSGMSEDENPKCSVVVSAEPVSPSFMTGHILGGSITKSNTAFGVNGSFSETENADNTNNFAGFLYNIVSSGVAEPGQTVTIGWDAAKLEFDKGNTMLASNYVSGTESGGVKWDTITFTPSNANRYFTIAFYRVDNATYWNYATAQGLNNLVTVTINN